MTQDPIINGVGRMQFYFARRMVASCFYCSHVNGKRCRNHNKKMLKYIKMATMLEKYILACSNMLALVGRIIERNKNS